MMWMMGYNDAGEFNTIQDPFTGRKLRPLMPRPVAAAGGASANLHCVNRADHFHGLNHHLAMVEQNKRELLSSQQVVVSSRWNPTAEQLQTLEELYRRGTRTPTAEQIQQITAQLRRYGKIEGKNVFYWFQNHKARERQKRRRQVEPISNDQRQQQPDNYNNKIEKEEKPPGSNRTAFEVEQTKNWASPTNSSTFAEKTTQGGTKGAEQAECKADGWVHFDAAASASASAQILLQQQQQRRRRRSATWQMMHLSSSSSSSPSPSPSPPSSSSSPHHNPNMYRDVTTPSSHHHFINIFNLEPYMANNNGDDEAAQTLELFPLHSGQGLNDDDDDEECGPMGHAAPANYQFFEFLPMKN